MAKSPDAFRTISEVSDWLDTPTHVLRFWESKFTQIRPVKRAGGRRYYRPADMELLAAIKFLLHEKGMTIKGVQKMLREEGVSTVISTVLEDAPAQLPVPSTDNTAPSAAEIPTPDTGTEDNTNSDAPESSAAPRTPPLAPPTLDRVSRPAPPPQAPQNVVPFRPGAPPPEPAPRKDTQPPVSGPLTQILNAHPASLRKHRQALAGLRSRMTALAAKMRDT